MQNESVGFPVAGRGERRRTAKFGRESIPDQVLSGRPAQPGPSSAQPHFRVPGVPERLRPAIAPVRAQGAFVGRTRAAGLAGRRLPHLTWSPRPPAQAAGPRGRMNGPRPPAHPARPLHRPSPRAPAGAAETPGVPGRRPAHLPRSLGSARLLLLLLHPGGGSRARSERASVRERPLHFLPAAAARSAPPSGRSRRGSPQDHGSAREETLRRGRERGVALRGVAGEGPGICGGRDVRGSSGLRRGRWEVEGDSVLLGESRERRAP